MTFKPYGYKIQVKPFDAGVDSPLLRDDRNLEESGTVIALGQDDVDGIEVGDTVYFMSHECWKIKVDGEDVWVITDLYSSILGVKKPDVAEQPV